MDADINLIERYLTGDEAAVDELVIKHQKQIYALTYRMTKDIEDAKDLTQPTFN
jgi:DNA-directed RNA polymerase specialized sigma24 family protein